MPLIESIENDNLRGEYSSLYSEVEEDVAWAHIALGQQPDAVNLWIGNSRSITSLHRDHYENVYCQIVGRKHFVLLPPVETACINEKTLTAATYVQKASTASVSDPSSDRDRAIALTCSNAKGIGCLYGRRLPGRAGRSKGRNPLRYLGPRRAHKTL